MQCQHIIKITCFKCYRCLSILQIDKRDVVTIPLKKGPEWKSIAVQALQLQKRAILLDIGFKDKLTFDTTTLRSILEHVVNRIQMYTDTDTDTIICSDSMLIHIHINNKYNI
jgi:hypothetical protein